MKIEIRLIDNRIIDLPDPSEDTWEKLVENLTSNKGRFFSIGDDEKEKQVVISKDHVISIERTV